MGIIEQKKVSLRHIVAVVLGVLIAVALIIQLNETIVVSACAEHGGRYVAEQRHCVDPVTGYKHPLSPTPFMVIGYILLILIIPFLCKRLVDAFAAWRQKNHYPEQ